MKSLVLFLLTLAIAYGYDNTICKNGFNLVNNKCWKLFQDPANHTTAENTCTQYGGSLFMAKNAIDNRAILSFVGGYQIDSLWMGIFCIGSDKSQCYWDDQTGTTMMYDNFATGFPNSGTGRCVYYSLSGYPRGQWLNEDCTEKMQYICELPTTHSDICDLNFNDNCYFRLDAQPFNVAQKQCEQMCGDMVSIHSAEENRFIASIYQDLPYDYIRIGGVATSPDFIVWTDGSTMDYNNLEKIGVNGICLYMALKNTYYSTRGAWYAFDCSTPYNYVCKRPVGAPNCRSTPAPPPPPQPTATATCTSGVHVAPGVISSPGYPHYYTSGCQYTLTTFGPNKIRLTFDYCNISPNDYIYIYDGESEYAPLISKAYTQAGKDPCLHQYDGHCYFPVNKSMNFGNAQDYCAKNCANLPSISSALENQYLNSIFKTETVTVLGAVAMSKTNIIWADLSEQRYNNIQNFGKENCVFTTLNSYNGQTGQWFTDDCTRETFFVCKRSIGVECNGGDF
ncbi:hypothetical protein CAEBREN_07901 [Caenorhabditis brenneri]|uniref:Uncharacterized protein n=1 Tax=Caenorhabditis brenneri TaxID=135651 RepID=G0N323_CAEBE|nr:hypothetical protein CAEBREN_07901 [Caenorhabditis brenneri]